MKMSTYQKDSLQKLANGLESFLRSLAPTATKPTTLFDHLDQGSSLNAISFNGVLQAPIYLYSNDQISWHTPRHTQEVLLSMIPE